jgi:hypothetical protein
VQVDPIKPKLKPPGTQHLKLNCDILLSTFAFKINVRRCNGELTAVAVWTDCVMADDEAGRSSRTSTVLSERMAPDSLI